EIHHRRENAGHRKLDVPDRVARLARDLSRTNGDSPRTLEHSAVVGVVELGKQPVFAPIVLVHDRLLPKSGSPKALRGDQPAAAASPPTGNGGVLCIHHAYASETPRAEP